MIVVVIIAILAAIAVPALTGDSRKTKANAEITAFFAELGIREEQYKVDNGTYLTTATCPASPSSSGQAVICNQPTKEWDGLNVTLPTSNAYCSYTITANSGTGTTNPIAGFTFDSPAGNWYYIYATCDMDGDGTLAGYFTSSVDSTIQKVNEGE